MAEEIDSEVDQILEHAERIKKVIRDLQKALPEFTEEEYDTVHRQLDC